MEKFETIKREDIDNAKVTEIDHMHANMFQSFNMSINPKDAKYSVFMNVLGHNSKSHITGVQQSHLLNISE